MEGRDIHSNSSTERLPSKTNLDKHRYQAAWLKPFGYDYTENNSQYPFEQIEEHSPEKPREGVHPKAGDLIAGSGASDQYRYMEAVDGAPRIGTDDKIHVDRIELFKRNFIEEGFHPILEIPQKKRQNILNKAEKDLAHFNFCKFLMGIYKIKKHYTTITDLVSQHSEISSIAAIARAKKLVENILEYTDNKISIDIVFKEILSVQMALSRKIGKMQREAEKEE